MSASTRNTVAPVTTDKITISPFGDLIGIEFGVAGAGKAHCRIRLADHHRNNGGRIHGGVLTALADTAAGMAVRTLRPEGKSSATTDLNIAFIRPPMGETLEAHAEVIHAGRRVYRTEVSVFSAEKLVARVSAAFMIL